VSVAQAGLQNAEEFYREADAMGAIGDARTLSYVAGGVVAGTEDGKRTSVDQLDKVTGGGVKRYLGRC